MAEPAVQPEEPEGKLLVLRTETGESQAVDDTPENREKQTLTAQERKAIFLFNKAGALARAAQLPRLLTGNLSAGATNMMLVSIIQGELKPATAKEAAEVAKITHAIFREASGATAGNVNLTPAERQDRLSQVDQLQKDLEHRANEATARLGGAPTEDEVVPDEPAQWEHETPDEPAG
jgi:hypothetical protein